MYQKYQRHRKKTLLLKISFYFWYIHFLKVLQKLLVWRKKNLKWPKAIFFPADVHTFSLCYNKWYRISTVMIQWNLPIKKESENIFVLYKDHNEKSTCYSIHKTLIMTFPLHVFNLPVTTFSMTVSPPLLKS